jgi:hypothetical protein
MHRLIAFAPTAAPRRRRVCALARAVTRSHRKRSAPRVFVPVPMSMQQLATTVLQLRNERRVVDDLVDWHASLLRDQLIATGKKSKTLHCSDGSTLRLRLNDNVAWICTEHHLAPNLCRDLHLGPVSVAETPLTPYLSVRPIEEGSK